MTREREKENKAKKGFGVEKTERNKVCVRETQRERKRVRETERE